MAAKVLSTRSSRPPRKGTSHPAQRCAPSIAGLPLGSPAERPVKAEQPASHGRDDRDSVHALKEQPSGLRPQMRQSLLEAAGTPAKVWLLCSACAVLVAACVPQLVGFLYPLLCLPGPPSAIMPEHQAAFIMHLHALGHVIQLVIWWFPSPAARSRLGCWGKLLRQLPSPRRHPGR